jgi:hypothetical protein
MFVIAGQFKTLPGSVARPLFSPATKRATPSWTGAAQEGDLTGMVARELTGLWTDTPNLTSEVSLEPIERLSEYRSGIEFCEGL